MYKMKKLIIAICILLCAGFSLLAQNKTVVAPSVITSKKILDGFMDKRFGMFIHWGPVSLRGTEIGWSRGDQVPVKEYDNLYKEFNPVLFNADSWVKTAKDAGMKYLTITAKHHDGFCLWPSAYTEYDIMSSPYKKDVVGELAKACKKYDIKFCIYYTVLDWYDPNYPIHSPKDTIGDLKADMGKFVTYMKNQLKELITNYHPYMLWFDGNWEKPWTKEYGEEVYQHIKSIDPAVIINNRLGKGKHTELGSGTVGDYATPEQFIGALNMKDPWESCITICDQWAWKPNDKMKSLKDCIHTLVKTAGGNGNLLLNVGPMLDGRIETRQVKQLQQMGQWLNKYGESIYGTKGGPYPATDTFATTRKGSKIYVHVLKHPGNELVLKNIPETKINKAYFLKGVSVNVRQDDQHIRLTMPGTLPDINSSVIVLELSKNAGQLPVIK